MTPALSSQAPRPNRRSPSMWPLKGGCVQVPLGSTGAVSMCALSVIDGRRRHPSASQPHMDVVDRHVPVRRSQGRLASAADRCRRHQH